MWLARKISSKRFSNILYGLVLVAILLIMYTWYHLPTFNVSHAENKYKNSDLSQEPSLTTKTKQFFLDGKSVTIISGAIHYFRFPRHYWKDRLIKMKQCGLNTIETYVPWNLHEPVPGQFNFSGDLDLVAFLKLAQELDLMVFIRPGPYICSEWEFGGLPSWLLRDPNMKVRTTYSPFMNAVKRYFNKLMPMLQPLQYNNGGPLVAFQLDNEYGSYFKDVHYIPMLKELVQGHHITELLFTSDNLEGTKLQSVVGVLKTINFKKGVEEHFSALEKIQPNDPLMVMEFWTGWFDWWGDEHHGLSLQEFGKTLEEILSAGASVNFYMFYGGTNFGFMNGGFLLGKDYKSDITSYDYDALISENGDLTPKYFEAKRIIAKHYPNSLLHSKMQPVAQKMPRVAYNSIHIMQYITIWDAVLLTEKMASDFPVAMEMLNISHNAGQSYGYTLYSSMINVASDKNILIQGLQHVYDRGILFIDHVKKLTIDNRSKQKPYQLDKAAGVSKIQIDVLVENGGRINWLVLDNQRKGLTQPLLANNVAIKHWSIHAFEMNQNYIKKLGHSEKWLKLPEDVDTFTYPSFFQATLIINSQPKDTYIDMTKWQKGVVFVNGRNLGRYWSIGPQKALYLPAPWLKLGSNEIIIFEEQKASLNLQFTDEPKLGS